MHQYMISRPGDNSCTGGQLNVRMVELSKFYLMRAIIAHLLVPLVQIINHITPATPASHSWARSSASMLHHHATWQPEIDSSRLLAIAIHRSIMPPAQATPSPART
uniref:Uncharacterized protein n=1 Tax=Plectus sambesii TaxID=2011161 RepID=A0A914W0G2_9BILA